MGSETYNAATDEQLEEQDTVTTANPDATTVKRKTIPGDPVDCTGTILVNSLTSKMGKVKVTCPLISEVTRKESDR